MSKIRQNTVTKYTSAIEAIRYALMANPDAKVTNIISGLKISKALPCRLKELGYLTDSDFDSKDKTAEEIAVEVIELNNSKFTKSVESTEPYEISKNAFVRASTQTILHYLLHEDLQIEKQNKRITWESLLLIMEKAGVSFSKEERSLFLHD